MQHQCQNCQKIWLDHDLRNAKNLHERDMPVPGERMPSGECPDCGALCQLVRQESDGLLCPECGNEILEWSLDPVGYPGTLTIEGGELHFEYGDTQSQSADGGEFDNFMCTFGHEVELRNGRLAVAEARPAQQTIHEIHQDALNLEGPLGLSRAQANKLVAEGLIEHEQTVEQYVVREGVDPITVLDLVG